jgi:hypothetical protein
MTRATRAPLRNSLSHSKRRDIVHQRGAQVQAWSTGDEAARRRILAGPIGRTTSETIDPARFGSSPNRIDALNGSPRHRTWCGWWIGCGGRAPTPHTPFSLYHLV